MAMHALRLRGSGCAESKPHKPDYPPAEDAESAFSDEGLAAREAMLREIREALDAAAVGVEAPAGDVDAARATLDAALGSSVAEGVTAAAAEEYARAIIAAPGALPPPDTYTSAVAVHAALEPNSDGVTPVKLLRSSWIKQRATKLKAATSADELRRLRLPRRQELERDEPEAFMPLDELRRDEYVVREKEPVHREHATDPHAELERVSKDLEQQKTQCRVRGSQLAVGASSYCWLSAEHPDPDGTQLVALAEAIEAAEQPDRNLRRFPAEAGIFLDFASLHQADAEGKRTEHEQRALDHALLSVHLWYAHPLTTAFITRSLPTGYEHLVPYDGRGWTTMESVWVGLAKQSTIFAWSPIFDVDERASALRRPAPLAPVPLARLLASKRFTYHAADLPTVIALNARTCVGLFGAATELRYVDLGWGDADVEALCEVLPLCSSLTSLQLGRNRIGDGGALALARAAMAHGTLPKLTSLSLGGNKIGEKGVLALSEALRLGALPLLSSISGADWASKVLEERHDRDDDESTIVVRLVKQSKRPRLGATFSCETVLDVTGGGLLELAGVLAGDRVLAISGTPFAVLTADENYLAAYGDPEDEAVCERMLTSYVHAAPVGVGVSITLKRTTRAED